MKFSSNTLLFQGVTYDSTRLHEERGRLGPACDGAGLDAVRAVRMDPQRGQGVPRASGAEPPQGINDAAPLQGHALPLRGFEQHDTDAMVDEGQPRQRLHDASQPLTVPHVSPHGLREVPQIGRHVPPETRAFRQRLRWLQIGFPQGGDQRHRVRPQARLGDAGAPCADAEHRRERGTQRGRHPRRWVDGWAYGLHPRDELICHAQLAAPPGAWPPLLHGLGCGRGVGTSGRAIDQLFLV